MSTQENNKVYNEDKDAAFNKGQFDDIWMTD